MNFTSLSSICKTKFDFCAMSHNELLCICIIILLLLPYQLLLLLSKLEVVFLYLL